MPTPPPKLCTCFGLSAADLARLALERGLTSVDELSAASTAGTGCRTCVPDLEKLLEQLWKGQPKPAVKPATPADIVRDAIRPFLNKATWELQLIDVLEALVRIRAIPHGEKCREAEDTLRQFVENRLKEMYRPDAVVVFV
ncbi:MAG: (2Fe-2S)-binding protein [Planctomycetes bacterium]|nr:(2Fe-2S)-binding protein [Planctomycetota bacterium]